MAIPSGLLEYKQWILWRRVLVDGRIAKLHFALEWQGSGFGQTPNMSTFRHVCYARWKFRSDGIGFVFTKGDPFCGIDLDLCRSSNGEITVEAQAVVERLASYTELSPSGTGRPHSGQSQIARSRPT